MLFIPSCIPPPLPSFPPPSPFTPHDPLFSVSPSYHLILTNSSSLKPTPNPCTNFLTVLGIPSGIYISGDSKLTPANERKLMILVCLGCLTQNVSSMIHLPANFLISLLLTEYFIKLNNTMLCKCGTFPLSISS